MWFAVQMPDFPNVMDKCNKWSALTVDVQPGRAGHNPSLILSWHGVPPGVVFCGSLNEQADVAMIVLVHAEEKDKAIRVWNL